MLRGFIIRLVAEVRDPQSTQLPASKEEAHAFHFKKVWGFRV